VRGVQADRGDLSVRDLDVAGNEDPVDKRCPNPETHRYPTTPAATGTSTVGTATPVSRSKKCSSLGSIATDRARSRSGSPASATPSLYTVYDAPPELEAAAVIGISQSGASPDVVAVLDEARRQRRPTPAITNDSRSPLAQAADWVLPVPRRRCRLSRTCPSGS